MKLFRTVFGNRAEEFEDRGDDLKLHGFWREAAWFYGRSLENLPASDEKSRKRVRDKLAEARHAAFRRLLEEAEVLAESGRKPDAVSLLRDAEPFAVDLEDRGVFLARLSAWDGTKAADPLCDPRAVPAEAGAPSEAPAGTLVEMLEREIVVRPESASAHERLARALEKEGRFNEAIRHFEAAYRRNREDVSLILEMARVFREQLKDPIGARFRLEEGCRRHRPTPATFSLHMERAFYLGDEGRDQDAIAALGELLAVPELDHGVILFNRAGLLERVERFEEARADLERAIALGPPPILYRERLADLLFRLSLDLPVALQNLDQALAVDAHDFAVRGRAPGASPDRARLQFKAARILYLLDRPAEALARVNDGLVVCWDPRVEESLLELRRALDEDMSKD